VKTVWKRRLFTTFVISFATALSPALAQTVQWTPFSSEELQFSVSFCGAPSANPPTLDKRDDRTTTTRVYIARGEDYLCFVAIAEYNFTPDAEAELLLNQTNFINSVNGTLGTSRLTEFVNAPEKLPALTFTFEMPPNRVGTSIVIVKGTRVYELVFTSPKNINYTAALQKFLSSFEITPPPEHPVPRPAPNVDDPIGPGGFITPPAGY